MIHKVLMALLIFGFFPELLGMLVNKWTKNEHKIFFNYIVGMMVEFALAEVMAVPMIIVKEPFTRFADNWFDVCFILSMLSFLINIIDIVDIIDKFIESLKKIPITIIFVVILVGMQTFVLVRYCHIDDDDARFVAVATIAIQQDKMYTVDWSTGASKEVELSDRDILSPFPMYTAAVAKHLDIHPAIVAHTVLPGVLIPLAYMIFWQLGLRLFGDDSKKAATFCFTIAVIYMMGDFSNRFNFGMLLYRIWQGKAILANIILPMSWLTYYDCVTENKIPNWITMYIVFIAGCFVSQMGIVLVPISIGILTLIYMIKYRRIGYGFKSLVCVLPCLIYFFMYLIIAEVGVIE